MPSASPLSHLVEQLMPTFKETLASKLRPAPVMVNTDHPQSIKSNGLWNMFEVQHRRPAALENWGYGDNMYDADYAFDRADLEHRLFGIDPEAHFSKRPTYGAVADRSNLDTSTAYGNYGLVLGKAVKPHTTLSFGDSLGDGISREDLFRYGDLDDLEKFNHPALARMLRDQLRSAARDHAVNSDSQAFLYGPGSDETIAEIMRPRTAELMKHMRVQSLADLTGSPYVEAQMHRPVTWNDVTAVVAPKDAANVEALNRQVLRYDPKTYQFLDDPSAYGFKQGGLVQLQPYD